MNANRTHANRPTAFTVDDMGRQRAAIIRHNHEVRKAARRNAINRAATVLLIAGTVVVMGSRMLGVL